MQPAQSAYGRLAAWVFLFFLVLYLSLARGHFWGVDEIVTYHQTRSLWEHGDLATAPMYVSLPGRDGRYYSAIGVGQSAMALPLYGLGKWVRVTLESRDAQSWVRTLGGPVLGDQKDRLWGGDVEIFFVNLFNSFTVSAICAVYFAFSLRLGAAPRWALLSAFLLGTTSHVAGFSTNFYQHAGEALFILWAFYFLFCDAERPDWRSRLWAGIAAAMMPSIRITTVLALPALSLYLLWSIWKRRDRQWNAGQLLLHTVFESMPFAATAAAGILIVAATNYLKFGVFSLSGGYAQFQQFDHPLWASLYAYLFSPGGGIFFFTPLIALAPWFWARFAVQRRAETLVVFGVAAAYVILCGKTTGWHSQWSYGVRYMIPFIPLLLLPLAGWLQELRGAMWIAVGLLSMAGLLVQGLHLLVNVSYVYFREGYVELKPQWSYLFIPEISQIPAHWRGLMAWDNRVDFWLLNVYRESGVGRLLSLAAPLAVLLALCGFRLLGQYSPAAGAWEKGIPLSFARGVPDALYAIALLWIATIILVLLVR